jgi:hypothetical protein
VSDCLPKFKPLGQSNQRVSDPVTVLGADPPYDVAIIFVTISVFDRDFGFAGSTRAGEDLHCGTSRCGRQDWCAAF